MASALRRVTRHIHGSWLAWLLVPALPLLGVWWIWRSQGAGGGTPLLGKILVGAGIGLAALLLAGLLLAPLQAMREGRLQGFLTFLAVALAAVVGFGAYSALLGWLESRTGPVVETLGVVCTDGVGVPDAKPVKGEGPFHAVVVGADGSEIDWSEKGADWRADSVEDTELVACVEIRTKIVETCSYRPVGSVTAVKNVTRERSVVDVQIFAAHSGRKLESFSIRHDPQKCPDQIDDDVERFVDPVRFDELSERIAELTGV